MSTGLVKTPMPTMNSGHKSRTSRRNGLRRRKATSQAERAWKMGGVVPKIRSVSLTRSEASTELSMKLRKEMMRQK